jgi:cytidyltransferase-like protein
MKKPIVVAVSGGFDPVHIGHVRMFKEAKALGDELVVILNNDHWLKDKKGFPFMPETERKEIVEAIKGVDRVVLTRHGPGDPDRSVCHILKEIKPDIFANGGDRKPDGDPVPEVDVCKELGIAMVYNVGAGGKVQSSSWLIAKATQDTFNSKKKKTSLQKS